MKLRAKFFLLWGGACLLSACATPKFETTSDYAQTHMLRLKCAGQGNIKHHSRLAVLDTDSSANGYDFGLVTGHGVPPGRPCQVFDFNGRSADVEEISFAPDYKSGSQSDWAVLKFVQIETPNLRRYPLEPIDQAESLDNVQIDFARARGLPQNQQSCKLEILEFSESNRQISHNCRNVAGQSGTPVTVNKDGEDYLIGLHLGQIWMFESPKTGRPDRKGYINLFNAETLDQIESAIDEMR